MSNLKRIIIHWDAGTGNVTEHAKECYHFLVDKKAEVFKGTHTPEDNTSCKDGVYAAHTGGGNTGSIGVSLLGMYGFTQKEKKTNYPINRIQFERGMLLVAQLCKKYCIPITENTVLTHYEFGRKHPDTTSRGKIDIIHLPFNPNLCPSEVGSYIRRKVSWYYHHLRDYKNLI